MSETYLRAYGDWHRVPSLLSFPSLQAVSTFFTAQSSPISWPGLSNKSDDVRPWLYRGGVGTMLDVRIAAAKSATQAGLGSFLCTNDPHSEQLETRMQLQNIWPPNSNQRLRWTGSRK